MTLKAKYSLTLRIFRRKFGFWLRCLLCWGIGCLVILTDESKSYDPRFQVRGEQNVSPDIVLILLRQQDISNFYNNKIDLLDHLADLSAVSDVYYWNKNLWAHLLATILKQNPRSVGISLFFGEHLHSPQPTVEENFIFHDPRITWAAPAVSLDRLFLPIFSNPSGSNLAGYDLHQDEDGVVRHVLPHNWNSHFVEKLAQLKYPSPNSLRESGLLTINFRGPTRSFKQYFLSDILFGNIPLQAFRNKIVIIGREVDRSHSFLTPQGPLSRAEIFAHIADNLLANRWVVRMNDATYALLLLVFMACCVFIITHYPQGIALFFLVFWGVLCAALSAWIFDTFYIWTPILAPAVILISSWIVFIGYQATKIERLHFRLQQEQKSMKELEQLKNNFVSLISHDLKTPLAKIQAILDRLLTQPLPADIERDLLAMRLSGEELNKYIRSILQVLRIESRDLKLHKEVTDINEIIQEVITQLEPLATEKNIGILASLEPMFSVELDIMMIKEVILNLIDNAIKYSNNGQQVTITSHEKDDFIVVEVIDKGEGIRPDELDAVWNKFTRGKDQDLKSKGSGLGLYLVKYFVELHGGNVQLQSQWNVGTTVSITLPIGPTTNNS